MTITLLFHSDDNGQHYGSLVIPSAASGAAMPTVGDTVTWTAEGNVYTGVVKSRLLTYSAPQVSVGRDDEVDMTATLRIALS